MKKFLYFKIILILLMPMFLFIKTSHTQTNIKEIDFIPIENISKTFHLSFYDNINSLSSNQKNGKNQEFSLKIFDNRDNNQFFYHLDKSNGNPQKPHQKNSFTSIYFSNLNKNISLNNGHFFWSLGIDEFKNNLYKSSGRGTILDVGLKNSSKNWKSKHSYEFGLRILNANLDYIDHKDTWINNSYYLNYSNTNILSQKFSLGLGLSLYFVDHNDSPSLSNEKLKNNNVVFRTRLINKISDRALLSLGLNHSLNHTLGFHSLELNKNNISSFNNSLTKINFSFIYLLNKKKKNNLSFNERIEFKKKTITEQSKNSPIKRVEKRNTEAPLSLSEFAILFSKKYDELS